MNDCPSIANRIRNDAKLGKVTSSHALAFIRRTCSCDPCKERRRKATEARHAKKSSNPGDLSGQ